MTLQKNDQETFEQQLATLIGRNLYDIENMAELVGGQILSHVAAIIERTKEDDGEAVVKNVQRILADIAVMSILPCNRSIAYLVAVQRLMENIDEVYMACAEAMNSIFRLKFTEGMNRD